MTGKERILNTILGKETDRVPIRLDGPFAVDLDVCEKTNFAWMKQDKRLMELHKYYTENCEMFTRCQLPGSNRFLASNHDQGRIKETEVDGGSYYDYIVEFDTPKGILTKKTRKYKNDSSGWTVEYPVKTYEDVEKILSIPQDGPEYSYDRFFMLQESLGEKGPMTVLVDTPLIMVSSVMSFEDFLMYTLTEPEMIETMVETAAKRQKQNLIKGIEAGLGPIFRIMGSEQATPPMNSIDVYDKLVFKYEKEYCDIIHEAGHFAQIHCHGNIRGILPRFLEEKADIIDPVEAPPSGDIDFLEAKKLVDGRITLAGNIQFDDLERCTPEEIETQVKGLFADGRKDHIIISTTAFPTTFLSENMARNIKALIDAGLKYGSF